MSYSFGLRGAVLQIYGVKVEQTHEIKTKLDSWFFSNYFQIFNKNLAKTFNS